MGVNECAQMVKTEIPTLDEDLSQYIESKLKWILILEVYFQTRGEFLYVHVNFSFLKGVLETSCEDFESGEDVFEAIGGVLQDVCDKSENEIRKLCNLNKASSFRISFLVIDNCQANRSGYQLKAYGEERLKNNIFSWNQVVNLFLPWEVLILIRHYFQTSHYYL